MQRCVLVWVCLGFCLVVAATAQSELEGFIGSYDPGSVPTGADFDNGSMFGFRIGQSVGVLGTEFSYTLLNDVQEKLKGFQGQAHLVNGNALIHFPKGRFVPYATAGLGAIVGGEKAPLLRLPTRFAWNVGGGVKLRYLFSHLGLRFDIRYYKVPDGVELPTSLSAIRKTDFTLAEATWGLLLTF